VDVPHLVASRVQVRVETDEGIDGWGENCPLGSAYLPAYARGTRAGIAELGPRLIGEDPTQLLKINQVPRGGRDPEANRYHCGLGYSPTFGGETKSGFLRARCMLTGSAEARGCECETERLCFSRVAAYGSADEGAPVR
jgi:hypothetical protein